MKFSKRCFTFLKKMCQLCEGKLVNIKRLYPCANVKYIPNIPGLKELICDNCIDLEEIADIKELEYLSLTDCSNIKEIPNITNLYKLNLSGMTVQKIKAENLNRIRLKYSSIQNSNDFFPVNLNRLELDRCTFSTLPSDLKKLEYLSLYECNIHNRTIPSYSNLKKLIIRTSKINFESIRYESKETRTESKETRTDFPNVEYLSLTYVDIDLTMLALFPNVDTLYINNCDVEGKIPLLNKLSYLNCNDCKGQFEITNCPNLKILDINNCPDLKSIPCFPKLRKLFYLGENIKNLPYLRELEEIHWYTAKNLILRFLPKLKYIQPSKPCNLYWEREKKLKKIAVTISKNRERVLFKRKEKILNNYFPSAVSDLVLTQM